LATGAPVPGAPPCILQRRFPGNKAPTFQIAASFFQDAYAMKNNAPGCAYIGSIPKRQIRSPYGASATVTRAPAKDRCPPTAAVLELIADRPLSTLSGRSLPLSGMPAHAPYLPFAIAVGTGSIGWKPADRLSGSRSGKVDTTRRTEGGLTRCRGCSDRTSGHTRSSPTDRPGGRRIAHPQSRQTVWARSRACHWVLARSP
jgi:hypothetical protein